MGYKKEEIKHTLDQLQVPVSLERFTKELPKRYREGAFDESRGEQVDREWDNFQKSRKKQWTLGKKVNAFTIAAAASFLIFVGSGFVSPTMAKMIAKIPPLSAIYNRDDVNLSDLLTKELKKEGYPVNQVREHVGGNKEGVYIFLDASDEKIKKMKAGIEKISFNILHSEKYKGTRIEDYYVKVRKFVDEPEERKKEQARIDKETTEIFEIVEPVLRSHGYNSSIGVDQDSVELEFPNTESQEKMDEIKKAVETALQSAGKAVKVEYKKFNLAKRQQYARWDEAVSGIANELKTYKKYQVSSVGYQSKDGLMRILIRIKLPSTDPKASELAADLNTMIEDFIKTKEIWVQVKDDRYEIFITSKDKKRLN